MIKLINMIFFSIKQLEIYFYSLLNNIVIENACHLSKSPNKMYLNYTVCVHVHNLHSGANLHPGANKLAPPRRQEQICTGCKFLKHRSHGQKYTPGANLHSGANCAHERGFRRCNTGKKFPIDCNANYLTL